MAMSLSLSKIAPITATARTHCSSGGSPRRTTSNGRATRDGHGDARRSLGYSLRRVRESAGP